MAPAGRRERADGADFYTLCGLLRPPALMRMRVLDPVLRTGVGGLGDITAPVGQLASLALPARTVLIVENLQTGQALGDLPAPQLCYRPLWMEEKVQHGATELCSLTPAESVIYVALKCHSRGQAVRLEQERIDWEHAWSALRAACDVLNAGELMQDASRCCGGLQFSNPGWATV